MAKLKKWHELPIGVVVLEPGSTAEIETGTWRAFKPIIDLSKCIKCLICWVYCPDSAIIRREDDYVEVDYYYCKGCGICAHECPMKCIKMVEEGV